MQAQAERELAYMMLSPCNPELDQHTKWYFVLIVAVTGDQNTYNWTALYMKTAATVSSV